MKIKAIGLNKWQADGFEGYFKKKRRGGFNRISHWIDNKVVKSIVGVVPTATWATNEYPACPNTHAKAQFEAAIIDYIKNYDGKK